MFFVGAWLILVVGLFLELELRKKVQQSPKNFAELWKLLSSKTSENKIFSRLSFCISALLLFCFWEGLMRLVLGLELHWSLQALGILLFALLLKRRSGAVVPQNILRAWQRVDFFLLWAFALLCLGPFVALVMLPWYFLRVQHYLRHRENLPA